MLYLTGKVLFKTQGNQIGLIAGIFYAIFTLINGGIGAQAEIFFIPPVVLAFYLLFSGKKIYSEKLMSFNNFRFLGMGLSIGVAAQIKYLVVFDFIALLVIIAKDIYSKYSRERIQFLLSKIIRHFTLVGSGVILVFSGTFLYFLYNGYFHEYFYATLLSHRQYVGTAEFSLIHFIGSLGGQIVRHFILYFSLFITPIFLYANNLNYSKAKKNIVDLIIWFLITFMATLISKRYYGHYFLQLLPPLCLVSSYVVTRTFYSSREFTKVKQRLILIPVTLGLLVSSLLVVRSIKISVLYIYFRHFQGINTWNKSNFDRYLTVAEYLQQEVDKDDYIYVHQHDPIMYFLTEAKVPTKYVFPGHLYFEYTDSNSLEEITNIMAKEPVYIIMEFRQNKDTDKSVSSQNSNTPTSDPVYNIIYSHLSKYIGEIPKTTVEEKQILDDELDKYLKKYYRFETSIEGIDLYKRRS